MGCTTAQGYHYSRPLPAEHLATWLRARDAHRRTPALTAAVVHSPSPSP
jgi:predicted signal transduction protein with EAL and GGDEF domain